MTRPINGTRPRAWWEDDKPLIPALQVDITTEPRKSGLVDVEGRPLITQAEPVGFLAKRICTER